MVAIVPFTNFEWSEKGQTVTTEKFRGLDFCLQVPASPELLGVVMFILGAYRKQVLGSAGLMWKFAVTTEYSPYFAGILEQ